MSETIETDIYLRQYDALLIIIQMKRAACLYITAM